VRKKNELDPSLPRVEEPTVPKKPIVVKLIDLKHSVKGSDDRPHSALELANIDEYES
jgi:hypothetical protein